MEHTNEQLARIEPTIPSYQSKNMAENLPGNIPGVRSIAYSWGFEHEHS